MVYQLKRLQTNKRPQAFWGSLIPSAISFIGGLITSSQQAKAQRRALEEQQRLAQQQLDISNQNQLATSLNNYASAQQSYNDKDYNLKYRIGGVKRLGGRNIMITDGGNAKRIGNNTYLLRGGSHEDINETGQTGIGINVGGNEIEAEGGEVAQRKGNSLRIYSAQPILGGISPAQAIMRGYNKDKVFNAQQRFKKNNGVKDDGSKAQVGGYYGSNYPSPLSLLSIIYDKTLGRFDDKNPNLQTGIAPTPSRSLNLKQVRSGLVTKSMLPTNRVYRGTNMREVIDAKQIGQYRALPEGVKLPSRKVGKFEFAKVRGNSHGGKAASMGQPWTGTTASAYGEPLYYISTPARHTTWQVGHHGRYSQPLPADAIKKGAGVWKKFDSNGNTGISTKRMTVYKQLKNGMYLRLPKSKYRFGGGLTSKDRGSSKHPYPSVSSKDFAGGNRSYPIPTKADAIDALRLAGLHGRSDVKAKVYSRYPELRNKAAIGTLVTPINAKDSYIWDLLGGDRNSQSITADLKTILGLNDMYGAEDGHDSNVQYAGVSIPYLTQIIKNSPRVAKSILRGTKLYGRDSKALVEAEGESAYNKFRRMFRGNNNAYSNMTNTYSPNVNTKFTGTPNNIRPYVEPVNPVRGASTRRAYNTAKMQAANSELKMINNPEYAEQIVGNSVRNFSKGMSGKALQSAIGVSKYQPSNFVKYGIPAFASLAAYEYAGRETDNTKKPVSTQKDVKGQPISPYIARPQEPAKPQAKPQAKKVAPARRDTVVTKPATRQVPDSIARKDTTRTDTTKQVNKVIKRQVRTTPQYTGNATRGNYQLHDGETKTINGVKYTRRGNTIINHKTNVGYIYDKNGNYTGQADYSKVGNFNQAFDAARAAGRSQFIYRAGKYQNYSTNKETDAKKEALNRRVGARRIAKRMGGFTNPPVGSRRKYLPGGTANPWDKYKVEVPYPIKKNDSPIYDNPWNEYKVPDYGGTAPWQISNKYDVKVPYPIGKHDLPITTITAKKDTFNDEMSRRMRAGVQNLKDSSDTNGTVPYLGRQSSFSPKAQDYIGLGIDTLAALGSGIFTRSAYNKMNFDYALPSYVDETPVAFDTTYHNEAQRANIERNRLNSRSLITGNTSSAQTALGRMQQTDTDAMMETNKLLDEKTNKEVELRNQNAANEQQVRARNAAARNQYYQSVAQIKNAALEAKNNMELARAQSIGADLSGLSQAWSNFAGSVENRYDARQNEIAAISSANSPSVVKNAISLGYNLSPEVLANLYKSSKNDELRNAILGRLSPYERKRYGIE